MLGEGVGERRVARRLEWAEEGDVSWVTQGTNCRGKAGGWWGAAGVSWVGQGREDGR